MIKFKNEKLGWNQLDTRYNFLKRSLLLILISFCLTSSLFASELYIGASSVNITPPLPVALAGQMHLRVATEIETPVTANIVALENRDGKERKTTIFISVDLVQLTGPGTYLPTMKAVKGGSYSAIVQSNEVGPEVGQLLVDHSVELINGMWPEDDK